MRGGEGKIFNFNQLTLVLTIVSTLFKNYFHSQNLECLGVSGVGETKPLDNPVNSEIWPYFTKQSIIPPKKYFFYCFHSI